MKTNGGTWKSERQVSPHPFIRHRKQANVNSEHRLPSRMCCQESLVEATQRTWHEMVENGCPALAIQPTLCEKESLSIRVRESAELGPSS